MKKAYHHIASVSMALLVLFSTTSFAVEQHFCCQELIDVAVFSEVEDCESDMYEDLAFADSSDESDLCCEIEKITFEGQDELKPSLSSLDLDQQLFLNAFTFSYLDLFSGLPEQVNPFKNYSPPLLTSNIQLLDQVFLI